MIEEKGRTCFDVHVYISVIWGRGKCLSKNFFTQKQFFLLVTEMKRGQIKKNRLRVGYRDLCVLRVGSNQCSPTF